MYARTHARTHTHTHRKLVSPSFCHGEFHHADEGGNSGSITPGTKKVVYYCLARARFTWPLLLKGTSLLYIYIYIYMY